MENLPTNTTAPGNPPYLWVGKSNQRSTFGILSFCLSTMIICVWSTLHFNIPTRHYTATRRFFVEIAWMLLALLAPEVLLFLAINERINAGILLEKALKFHPHLAKPGVVTRIYANIRGLATSSSNRYNATPQRYFTLSHAFYATMGGVVFCIDGDDTVPFEESLFELSTKPHYVPSLEAYSYIVEHFPGIFTNIHEKSILDRAKSSSMSKALLIVQVGWFCTSCVSRLIQHLPLSLLEVTTAAHSFCTLLTYFVWWSKPFNVMAPTIITGKKAQEMYALLNSSNEDYLEALKIAQDTAVGDSSSSLQGNKREDTIAQAANILQHCLTAKKPPGPLRSSDGDGNMLVPGCIANGWGMLWKTVAISPTLYGLVHFLAWSDNFPTPLEGSIWRASSVVVICSGLVGTLGGKAVSSLNWWKPSYMGLPSTIIKRFVSTIVAMIVLVMLIIPIAHILASGFLIAESTRQLFFLDPAAYRVPSWSNYWPHLS